MKRKRLDRDRKTGGWGFEQHPYYQMRVDIEEFHGLVCLIQIVGEPGNYICWDLPKAGKTAVCGGGMTWLQLIPDGKKRVITAKYIPEKKVIQGIEYSNSLSLCYVDIIENIEYDTDSVVVFIDKYLDVVFTLQGDVEICDREELDEAFQSGELSKEQYDSALTECELIIDELCSDITKTELIFSRILSYVNDRIDKGEKEFERNNSMQKILNEEKVILSDLYTKRIKNLHDDKRKINDEKIKALGSINIDDHGFVYFPDFNFTPTITRDYGKVTGMYEIGVNFRRFLNEIPQYTNKNSALGGAWTNYLANYVPFGIAPDDYPNDLKKIWDKYFITQPGFGAMNHCAGDIEIGLKLGWKGLLDKIRYYREFNAPADTTFYDGEEELVLGIIEWVKKIAAHARKLAETEKNQDDKNNLLEIADMNDKLAEYPPSTMREACQFIAHFQSVDRMYFSGGALDQLDEKLRPYYEKDIQTGILTDEKAVWYIASLFFNDTHYSQIAGLTPDGSRDMTSRLSFIILDAMHCINIPVNLAIRVHDNVNKTLLRRSLEYMIEDGSGVCYSCNIGCEDGYAKNGYAPAMGKMRAKVGCNWTAIPGREYPLQDVTRLNMAQALLFALEDLKDTVIIAGEMDILFDRFKHHLQIMVDSILDGFDRHFEVISRNTPEIVYNLFMHGPIERGLNCAEGGVDIINFNIDGISLATVADSFAAIEQRIVIENKLSFEELFDVLDNNFEGKENIRLMLKNIKRLGDPDSKANLWAEKIRDEFVRLCRRNTPKHNIKIIPGMFSHGDIYSYGKKMKATPNGRFAGEPISHSNEPDPGFARGLDSFSPSLKATSVAKLQPGYGNSAPLHLDIDTNMLSSNGGIDALIALIHTHNHMGGTLINMNCLSEQKLREAHENPASHPDLVVRVTGYSAFFSSLSKEYRQQIIDRFLSAK